MTGERWDELKRLFHGALDQPPDRRGAWLEAATGDEGLRREAERLVQAHDTAGAFLETPPPMAIPDRIGPYDIERELGRGGMGVVYLARDSRLHRRVALKSLPPLEPADTGARERLQREARVAASLTHPGIATVYALEDHDEGLYLASEYVGERTVRDLLRGQPLSPARAVHIVTQVARALAAAHDAGIVHRDLKPENIVLADAEQDVVKVVDFGIARLTGPGAGAGNVPALAGTLPYLAPEQLAGLPADARTDLYALGVVLGEMLTGAHPLASSGASMPPRLQAIVSRCLASEPHARYQSARALLDDLDRLGQPAGGSRTRAWWVFHQAATVAAYLLLLIPLWSARELIGGTGGRTLFLAALAASVVSSALRLHRWFAVRWYVDEFGHVRRQSTVPLRVADVVFALSLLVAGLALGEGADPLAVLLISAAAAVAVAFLLVEPATTRAAFMR